MNRSKNLVIWAGVAVVLLLCLVMVCQVRSCARRVMTSARGTAGRIVGSYLLPQTADPTEPQRPSIVPPGHSARPSASRRPVFGRPMDEGVDVEIQPRMNTDERADTVRLRVRKDGGVQNIGKDTVALRVTKYGPAWIEWDPSVGVCAFVSRDRSEWMPVARRGGYCLDAGGKLKLLDFRPLHALQIGIPTLYATTAIVGIGCDLRITGMEWIALDVGYFPVVKRAAVGVSVNIP